MKKLLLAGVSCLAVLTVSQGVAAGVVFTDTTAGFSSYTVTNSGTYSVYVEGASGGAGYSPSGTRYAGGLGYAMTLTGHLDAGQTIYFYVGGQGQNGANGYGGGGGGSSAALLVENVAGSGAIAGGGGGGGNAGVGYAGQPIAPFAPGGAGAGSGGGNGGGLGGPGGYGFGQGGAPGGGFGTNSGSGYGGYGFYAFQFAGSGGKGYRGGGAGGYGASGGGGAFSGGGGGGGVSGGGGGGVLASGGLYGGGGGGGSYLFVPAQESPATAAYGNGEVSVDFIAAPEPASWWMMITGLGFLGYMLRRRWVRAA